MPKRLHCYYGAGYLHFITTSCYQRRALLGSHGIATCFSDTGAGAQTLSFRGRGICRHAGTHSLAITQPEVGTPSTVLYELQASLRDAFLIWRDDPALEAPGYFRMSLTGQSSSVPDGTKFKCP